MVTERATTLGRSLALLPSTEARRWHDDETRGVAAIRRGGDRRAPHADSPVMGVARGYSPRRRGRRPRRGSNTGCWPMGRGRRLPHTYAICAVEQRTIALGTRSEGNWSVDGKVVRALKGCTDVDLGCSPSTNTLPIRAWLGVGASKRSGPRGSRFPELTDRQGGQTYTRLTSSPIAMPAATRSRNSPSTTTAGWSPSYAGVAADGLFAMGPDDTEPLDAMR